MGQARESVRALLNAPSPDNIVFGMNMTTLTFHLSRIISRDWQAGDEVIVTALDHYANVSSWQQAAADKGAVVHQIPLESADCSLDAAKVCERINANTRLVAVSYASNVTGSIVDIKTIVEAAHRVGAQVYVDAVHYAPHNLIDVQALGCDFLVCSAYKFLARTSAWPTLRRSGCNACGHIKSNWPPTSAPAVSRPARKASRRWPASRRRSTIWRSGARPARR